jgi:pimeloyl-ACP methyl ester carboxylesterase
LFKREEARLATLALIHGAGDSAWYWHLLEPELRDRGHEVVTMDLPCDDDSAGLTEYADTVVDAIGHCIALSRPKELADLLQSYLS